MKIRNRRGMAVLEFSMASVFLVPMLIGTLVYGFRLIRSIEMFQITRDLGHMYVRGVNFANAGPQQNAQTLASGFNLTSTGTSLVVLSQIVVETQAACDAANIAPAGTPCANLGQPVFVQQLTIGNTSCGVSPFGTPPTTAGNVSVVDQARNPSAVAQGFASVMTLPSGVNAYMAEMINLTPDLNVPGFSGKPQVYARTIF
jgi:hypothetical protein